MQPPHPPLLRFDFADPLRPGPVAPLLFAAPRRVLVAHALEDVRPVLREAEAAARAGAWAAGFLAYEAAPAFDPALVVRPGAQGPLAWFGLFDAPLGPDALAADDAGGEDVHFGPFVPSIDHDAYNAGVEAVREAIAAGETYQLNYTLRLHADFRGSVRAAYARLRRAQGRGFCARLELGELALVSASPELFFHREGDRLVTRPMKGTARRGRFEEEDAARAAWLHASEKNRAENVMIVDLLRNDLGRVARTGSVRPTRLFDVERYPTVLQMTSTVEAEARPGTSLDDVFAALFPCGSITGAPKVSTMRLIARLESAPREAYCGAVGLVRPGGDATFNVAIRTLRLDVVHGRAEYGTGGGITWDSTPADEHAEALAKARVLTERWPDFELLETLHLEDGAYGLLERHLARLASSARYFGRPCDEAAVRAALAAHARAHPGLWRVRLLLSEGGAVRVEGAPLVPLPEPLPVALARTPVSRHDRFLFHKTTHRAVYDARRAERPDVAEVILWNEEGELTELTTGNLVLELDGRRLTPPRDAGLLAGTLRAELLATGQVHEAVLPREALGRATRAWLVNGVRGWVPLDVRP